MESEAGYYDRRLYGFKEAKYEELLLAVYKATTQSGDLEPRSVLLPLKILLEEGEKLEASKEDAKFELSVSKEYTNEPEPKVGLMYLLQKFKAEGRVFSSWKNCGSKKANSLSPSTLKIRYFQHKAPELSHIRKRVITLTADNDEYWKLVHIIHKTPKESSKKRKYVPIDSEVLVYNNNPSPPTGDLYSLASLLHRTEPMDHQSPWITSLVPSHGPPDAKVVVKIVGGNFSKKVTIVWGGSFLQEGVIVRNENEIWVEAPAGCSGTVVDVCIQEMNGEGVWRSNQHTYTYDISPQDEPLFKSMKLMEEKLFQLEQQMTMLNRNAGTTNNNNNSEEVENWLQMVSNFNKALEEARQLLKEMNERFHTRNPSLEHRIESLRLSFNNHSNESSPRQRAKRQALSSLYDSSFNTPGRPVTRSVRTTEAEHHALLALQTLCGDSSSSEDGDSPRSSTCLPNAGSPTAIYFYCSECDVHCNGESNWQEHLKSDKHQASSQNPKEFFCETCAVQCISQPTFKLHMESKAHQKRLTGASEFVCETCGVSCNNEKALEMHLASKVHSSRGTEIGTLGDFFCRSCATACSSRQQWEDHLNSKGHIRCISPVEGAQPMYS